MKKRKQSIATLKARANKLFQQVFVANNPTCIVCGGKTNCGHHVIYKSQSANLRYDMDNMVALCLSCHCKHHQSGDSSILAKIIQVKGFDWYEMLQEKRHILLKINKGYMEEVVKELKELSKE